MRVEREQQIAAPGERHFRTSRVGDVGLASPNMEGAPYGRLGAMLKAPYVRPPGPPDQWRTSRAALGELLLNERCARRT